MRKDLFRHKILFLALAVSILFVLWLQSASFVRLGLAGYFYDKQDYMKAASCYGKIIRKISKNPSAIPESALYGFTQCYLKQAEYYYARGEYKKVANLALDWDEALALYGVKDLKIIPKWYDLADTTYQLLADKYLNEGKFDDAVKMCTYFIKYSPDNRKAYVLLLDIYKKSEKWSLFLQASRDYAEKFKAEPDFGISNSRQAIGLSIAYLHEGNQDKAMYWADRSLEIADNIQQGLGILNNVLLYEHTEAFLHFNIARFLILEKDYKNAYRSLAEAMRFSGKDSVIWKKSEDAAFALMRLEPPDIDVFIRLGYAYEGKEYYKKAVWAFRCARKISRNNLMVLQNLKHIYVESRKDNMQLNLIQASIDKALEGIAPIDVFVNGSHENIFPIKIYEAEDMPRVTGEKIQDARASGNFAVMGISGKDKKYQAMTFGPYIKLSPGRYNVYYRIKTDNIDSFSPVALISAFDQRSCLAYGDLDKKEIMGSDFIAPDSYEDFCLTFYYPGGEGLQFATYFTGKGKVCIDRIAITVY